MGPLLVSLVLTPTFAEVGTPLSLKFAVRSDVQEAKTLTLYKDDACFAVKQLRLTLADPKGKELALPACADESVEVITVAPEGVYERAVDLTKLFPAAKWTAGRWKLDLSWNHLGPNDAGRDAVGQSSTTGEPIIRAKPLQTFTLKPKGSVTLKDGSVFVFRAHGHKHVMAGDKSPLIIRGEFGAAGKKKQEFDANVMTDEERDFVLDDRTFELLEYEYDGPMKLKYYGKVKREFED